MDYFVLLHAKKGKDALSLIRVRLTKHAVEYEFREVDSVARHKDFIRRDWLVTLGQVRLYEYSFHPFKLNQLSQRDEVKKHDGLRNDHTFTKPL